MSASEFMAEMPAGFDGTVRLFPLPNLVLFPHVVQPLRIFEPRYQALMQDALAGDQLITLSLLQPGWEPHYFAAPPIAPVACIGRIISHTRQADSQYKLLLLGLRRAKLVEELPRDEGQFRRARVEVLEDQYSPLVAAQRPQLQQKLLDCFYGFLPEDDTIRRQYEHLLGAQLPLGPLTDIVAFSVGLSIEIKQQLLGELNVDRRAATLLELLPSVQQSRLFPPGFSEN